MYRQIWNLHKLIKNDKNCNIQRKHTCESLFPRSIMDAAVDAAFSCASICSAIPTSARAKDGASFMPSPTFQKEERERERSISITIYPKP